jgi:hypothetical protein
VSRHPQQAPDAHDRQSLPTVGVTPLLGELVGGGAADAQHPGRFHDCQEVGQATPRRGITAGGRAVIVVCLGEQVDMKCHA